IDQKHARGVQIGNVRNRVEIPNPSTTRILGADHVSTTLDFFRNLGCPGTLSERRAFTLGGATQQERRQREQSGSKVWCDDQEETLPTAASSERITGNTK